MTTTTKIAGEAAMTDEQIEQIAREHGTGGWQSLEDMKRFARALLASKAAVPEGWKLVPVERSYDMRVKAIIAFNTAEQSGKDRDDALDAAWQAMLAAAPTAPAQSCGDAEQADEAVTYEQIANRFLKEDDFAALFTFHSQCSDSECDGYTERPETMERLAELGVVQRLIGGRGKRYGTTAFGAWLVEAAFSQNPGWPLRTTAEHNKRESAGHALYLRESVPNSIAWVKLDRNTRESWRRKALPDLVDAACAKDSK